MSGSGVAGSLGGAEDTIKDFWASRPRRPRHGRKVAGVAAGIGNRYRIDPVIVRVALVVATLFGGGGLLFYLLGWVFLAEEGDEVAPFESMVGTRRSSTSSAFTVLLCLAMIPAAGLVLGHSGWLGFGGFSGFFSLLLLLGGLYLLHHARGADGRPEPVNYPASSAAPVTAPLEWQHAGWDPLGAAPLAWDLPEPAADPPPPTWVPRHCGPTRAGAVVFGLAVLTAAICAGLTLLGVPFFTPVHDAGITLAVLGLGMIGASFAHGGRGLVFPAIVLGILAVLATGPTGWNAWHGAGEVSYRPASAAEVQGVYQRSVGRVALDLRGLPADTGAVRTAVRNNAGEVDVLVPADADVVADCTARAGQVDCLGREADGVGRHLRISDDGPDGPGGPRIELTASATVGSVEVHRG